VGKFARQLDDNSLWMLTAVTPTWIGLGGTVEEAEAITLMVKKSTAGMINAGEAVYVNGHDGTYTTVEKSKADSSATMPMVGVAKETITDASAGRMVIAGRVSGIDTSAWNEGVVLYVSKDTAGALTSIRPTGASSVVQRAGIVLHKDASTGMFQVRAVAACLPNLTQGMVWKGDANGQPQEAAVAIATSTAPVNVTRETAAVGTSAEAARQDHKHDISTASAGTAAIGDSSTEGTATSLARSDHKHGISGGSPVSVGTANADGTATTFARSDHVHSGLKREAADFASFTEKTALVAADLFLLEDSEATGTKKKAQLRNIPRKIIQGSEDAQDDTTSLTYVRAYRFSATLEAEKYLVLMSWESQGAAVQMQVRVRYDDTTDLCEHVEYCHLTDWTAHAAMYFLTATAASHTFDFDILTGSGAKTASIRRKRIALLKVVE
jgi:hypothetical protein